MRAIASLARLRQGLAEQQQLLIQPVFVRLLVFKARRAVLGEYLAQHLGQRQLAGGIADTQ